MILRNPGTAVEGEKLIAISRKITKPILISATAKHRGQLIYVYGLPATCYIDKPCRALHKPKVFKK
jgi:hypothetical protein